MIFNDRKFQKARIWSNTELKKFAELFAGKIVNVSGWQDKDKQGKHYKDYFKNASEYFITNYKKEAKGFQGNLINELFLDLEKELPEDLIKNFDVVFNHTCLEHIFEISKAFENLCKLSKDIVIIVVPFLQEYHGNYGDYWRFSPLAIQKLFAKNGFYLQYLNYNNAKRSSIYIFAIASRYHDKWESIKKSSENRFQQLELPLGKKQISNSNLFNIELFIRKTIKQFFLKKNKA